MIRSQILRWVGVAALSVLATGVSPLLGADLPGEYQRVEYIQSVGGGNNGQRIDTDYVHNSKTKIVCRVALEKAKLTSQWGAIFGARNGNYKANGYSFFIRFSNATKPVFCRTGAETQGSDFALDEIVTLTCEGLSAEWVGEESGVSGSITSTGTNDDGVNPMVIFNLNTGAKDAVKPDIAYVPMKLYSFQIYEADQLVRDFVPCYRKADGAIGLYDCALGTFFANAGSGAFLKGDDVFDLSQLNVSGSPDRFGEVTPAYGTTNGLAAGESFVCSAPACGTNDEKIVAKCLGYVVYTNGFEYVSGLERSFTYTHPDCAGGAVLVWQWEPTHYKLDVDVVGGGTVDVESQFVTSGSVITVTATPNVGMKFWKWTGTGATEADRYRTSMTVTMTEAKTLTANFYDPATTPRIVRYVTPSGAGTKDGTSWANAGTLAAMIAKVGINPPGGEVRLKKGAYQMASGSVELMRDTRVIGGYAGESEDEEPTGRSVLHGSNNDYVWYAAGTSTGIKIVDKTAGCINLPPFADYPATVKWTSSGNYCVQWSLVKSVGSLANSTLENLDLATAYSFALKLTTTGGDGFTVKNCRFVANTYGQGDGSVAVQASNSNYVFEDCEFYCNRQAFRSESSVAGGTNFLRRCLFKHNANCDYSKTMGASAVSSDGKSCFVIEDCVFEDNVADNGNYGPSASLAVNSASGIRVSVSNCMFRGNYSANKAAGNCKFNIPDSGLITFDDCSFVGNTNGATGGYCNSSCVGIDNSASIRFRNCYFARNCSDIGTGSATSIGAILAIGFSFDHNVCFVNCTIEDNYARSAVGHLVNEYRAMHHMYINCLFRNNDCFKGDGVTRSEEIVRYNSWTGPNALCVVNTIFMHAAADYSPVAQTDNFSSFGWANSYVQGIDFTGRTYSGNGFGRNFLTDIEGAPKLSEDYAFTAAGMPTLGIAEDSPLRKLGRKVWEGNDGWYYIYDKDSKDKSGKKWRALGTNGTNAMRLLSDDDAAALGLSLAKAPIEDAVGHARVKRPSPGPVDFPLPGMMLLVK